MRHTVKGFTRIWAVFIFIVFLVLLVRGCYFVNHSSNGQHVYQITVHNFSGDEVYFTSEYERVNGCLTFKDEFGLKNQVCGNYSITEY